MPVPADFMKFRHSEIIQPWYVDKLNRCWSKKFDNFEQSELNLIEIDLIDLVLSQFRGISSKFRDSPNINSIEIELFSNSINRQKN